MINGVSDLGHLHIWKTVEKMEDVKEFETMEWLRSHQTLRLMGSPSTKWALWIYCNWEFIELNGGFFFAMFDYQRVKQTHAHTHFWCGDAWNHFPLFVAGVLAGVLIFWKVWNVGKSPWVKNYDFSRLFLWGVEQTTPGLMLSWQHPLLLGVLAVGDG